MPHSLFSRILKNAFSLAAKNNPAMGKLLQQRQESRRTFLRNTAITATGMALIPSLLNANNLKTKKNIAIIGAGIAGLNAAYQFKKLGLASTVYEASNRVGGRMFTLKNYFGENITTDIGGEFIDANHEDILQLVKELNLEFYDLRTDTLQKETLYFDGKAYTEKDLTDALQPYINQLVKDITSIPEELTYKNAAQFEHLDKQSIKEYLLALGINGWLYNFLDVLLNREYGMEIDEQSALNFLIMLDKSGEFYGEHEIYKIKGGSQHLTDAIYNKVKDNIKLRHQLFEIKETNNQYELSFKSNNTTVNIKADFVILALPFSVLRKIKMEVPMPAEKRKCIDEFGYGNSSKYVMGFTNKPWRKQNRQGYTFTNENFGCGWDSTHMQSDEPSSFTVFGGGNFSDKIFQNKQKKLNAEFIPVLNKIYSGEDKAFTGKNIKLCWAKQPFTKAGYTSFKKGQYSTIAGWEAMPVGNIYFAGEHVSGPFQGFMNGAAATGKIAAQQVATKILLKKNNKK